jgi:hypothetical protein
MKTLDLTSTEAETLRDVVHHYLGELEVEIRHTDTRDFKAMLRNRKAMLESILAKLALEPLLA